MAQWLRLFGIILILQARWLFAGLVHLLLSALI